MRLRQLTGWTYAELAFHLADSQTYRAFCRVGALVATPSKSALAATLRRVRPTTLAALNDQLVTSALARAIEPARTVRMDATVVPVAIHPPTDSSLLLAPVQVSMDGGFASRDNLAAIKQLTVTDVCFAKKRGITVPEMTASLDPTVGSEMAKRRPVVIVSRDELNDRLNTVTICPLTSQLHPTWRTRLHIRVAREHVEMALDRIRSIAKDRMGNKLGALSAKEAAALRRVIAEMYAAE